MSDSISPGLGEDFRLENSNGTVSLWWTHVPPVNGEQPGVIGQFFAPSQTGAAKLLAEACDTLRAQGCTLAIGPMDGNTWRRYRFVTESGDEPAFWLEPANPPEWPQWWSGEGFETLAEYFSTATDDLLAHDPRVDGIAARMKAAGVSIRSIDPARFEEDLERIYKVSLAAFAGNYLYSRLPREAFFAQYRSIRDLIRPELVLLAEQEGKPVGYVFTVPDFTQAQRDVKVDTIIVKTLAVLPARRHAGLGAWLLAEAHAAARDLGFARAIHALMHETNKSRNLSARYAKMIRRYTLFSKRLSPGFVA